MCSASISSAWWCYIEPKWTDFVSFVLPGFWADANGLVFDLINFRIILSHVNVNADIYFKRFPFYISNPLSILASMRYHLKYLVFQ